MYFYLLLLSLSSCSHTVTPAGSFQKSHLASGWVLPAALWMVVWAGAGEEPPPAWEPGSEQKEAINSPVPLDRKEVRQL